MKLSYEPLENPYENTYSIQSNTQTEYQIKGPYIMPITGPSIWASQNTSDKNQDSHNFSLLGLQTMFLMEILVNIQQLYQVFYQSYQLYYILNHVPSG